MIADAFEGKPLNSPNDVVVKSDGSIWFTDPPFGLLGYYEGYLAKQELPMNVYRVDSQSGEMTIVEGDVARPNGLCFSPDESALYLVESGTTPRNVYAYDVVGGRKLSNKRKFIDVGPGTPDGMACDWTVISGWAGEWATRAGRRERLQHRWQTDRPHQTARALCNLCFGGTYRNRLFMAAAKSVYALCKRAGRAWRLNDSQLLLRHADAIPIRSAIIFWRKTCCSTYYLYSAPDHQEASRRSTRKWEGTADRT